MYKVEDLPRFKTAQEYVDALIEEYGTTKSAAFAVQFYYDQQFYPSKTLTANYNKIMGLLRGKPRVFKETVSPMAFPTQQEPNKEQG
jgi:hypothetical protein